MKNQEFLEEVLNANCCPDHFKEIYKEFQIFQELTLNTLNQFQIICEKHGIVYQLAYGSLLGAIRDGGQLPWDYDVDVIVPYEEKDRLVNALRVDLPENYYFRCPEVDEKCERYFLRLAPKGYHSNVLHVDVFYLIGSSDDKEMRQAHAREVAQCARTRFGKYVDLKEEAAGNIKRYLSFLVKKKLPTFEKKIEKVDRRFEQLCMQFPLRESRISITADIYAGMWEFPSSMVLNTKLIDTDYGTVRIPVQYDEILTRRYGDYLKIPALESRLRELLFHYNRIKYFVH